MLKDLNRGQGNRLAPGASLLGEGNSPADHKHVSRATPLDTKRKELKADGLGTALGPDLDKSRQSRTTNLRRAKDVRPL